MDQTTVIIPPWPAPPNVKAYSTTRIGGVSQGPYSSLNLAHHVDDNPDHVKENREIIKNTIPLPDQPHWLTQIHSNRVLLADNVQKYAPGDGTYTHTPNVVCAVLAADCLPILICNHHGTAVAALHGGWRGLADGIIENGIRAMGIPEHQLMAWLGPAIGPKYFEVGPEVKDRFVAMDPNTTKAFTATNSGKYLANIYLIAQVRLNHFGIREIYGGNYCTYSEQERFYSYRRDGATGRMASMIYITNT